MSTWGRTELQCSDAVGKMPLPTNFSGASHKSCGCVETAPFKSIRRNAPDTLLEGEPKDYKFMLMFTDKTHHG
jgi:hypothetical protein